jgi:hypothetical protein
VNYWPDLEDKRWPDDLPREYYNLPDRGDGITWTGLRSVVIGLCRRVEWLESRVRELEQKP